MIHMTEKELLFQIGEAWDWQFGQEGISEPTVHLRKLLAEAARLYRMEPEAPTASDLAEWQGEGTLWE
jgi:hypothetical protein